MSLVCSVCTLSDQLQATGASGADTAYLWACFNENCLVQSSCRKSAVLCAVAVQGLKTVYK